jgi:5'-AMP-activated protein kinase regulatory beta subunit
MAKELTRKSKITFALQAPEAREVRLAGCFTQWEQGAMNLRREKTGTWKKTIALLPGTYEYRYIVDGRWQDDPACPVHKPNTFGSQNNVRVVTAA